MNVKDEIIKEIKGISLCVITESGKERTVLFDFNKINKSELTVGHCEMPNYLRINVDVEGFTDGCVIRKED